MSNNSFSSGRNITLTVVTASGPLELNQITGFQSAPVLRSIASNCIDGVMRNVDVPEGWRGTFTIARQDNTLDEYFAKREADYFAGKTAQPATITETISEGDGSISQYRYIGVTLRLADAGGWQAGQTVKQSVSFLAAQRMST